MLEVTAQNQESVEQGLATILIAGFPSLNPSPECNLAFRSFSCHYAFGACDSNSSMTATKAVCMDVRDRVCAREWREISDFAGVPICEDLPSPNFTDCNMPGITIS